MHSIVKKQVKSRCSFLVIVFMVSIFCCVVVSQSVVAHPPSDLDVSYDFDEQVLTVVVTHPVSDPSTHYIHKVEVYVNDVDVIDEDFQNQQANDSFTLEFSVGAEAGDEIKVEAECNINGKLEETIFVSADDGGVDDPGDGSEGDPNGTQTPGFDLMLVVFGIFVIIFWAKKRK